MAKKGPGTASEALCYLNEFLQDLDLDVQSLSTEELGQHVQRSRLDTEAVMVAATRALEEAKGRLALEEARRKRAKVKSLLMKPRDMTEELRESLLARIQEIAGTGAAAVYARKLEESPDEDLRSLLQDFDLLGELDLDDDDG